MAALNSYHELDIDRSVSTWCLYSDVMMSAMASQISGLSIVYSTVCWSAGQREKSKPRVTGLCEGNTPVTGGFSSQRASNAKSASIWWRHHAGLNKHGNWWQTSFSNGVSIHIVLQSFLSSPRCNSGRHGGNRSGMMEISQTLSKPMMTKS